MTVAVHTAALFGGMKAMSSTTAGSPGSATPAMIGRATESTPGGAPEKAAMHATARAVRAPLRRGGAMARACGSSPTPASMQNLPVRFVARTGPREGPGAPTETGASKGRLGAGALSVGPIPATPVGPGAAGVSPALYTHGDVKQQGFEKRVLEIWMRSRVPLTKAHVQHLTGVPRRKVARWLDSMTVAGVLDADVDDGGEMIWTVRGAERPRGGPEAVAELERRERRGAGVARAGGALATAGRAAGLTRRRPPEKDDKS